jgi:hypothetical protein
MCGDGAAPLCIGSAEENAFVATNVASQGFHWTGRYQKPGSTTNDGGWDGCVSGVAPTFTSWSTGSFIIGQLQPDDNVADTRVADRSVDEKGIANCAILAPTGEWLDDMCDSRGMVWPMYPCLCASPGEASETFLSDLPALESHVWARHDDVYRLMGTVTLIFVLLPLIVACCSFGCCRRRRRQQSAIDEGNLSKLGRLQQMQASVANVRLRVSGGLLFFGWFVFAYCTFIPIAGSIIFTTKPHLGPPGFYTSGFPIGISMLLLAVLPTDVRIVQVLCFVVFVVFCLITPLQVSLITNTSGPARIIYILNLIAIVCDDVYMFFTIQCCCKQMTTRQRLARVWSAVRIMCFVFGLSRGLRAILGLGDNPSYMTDDLNNGAAQMVFSSFLIVIALITTRANRGRFRRWLGSLGSSGSAEQDAAAVASLLGGRSAEAVFANAKESFRVLPVSMLKESDMTDNVDAAGLFSQTIACELGECDAFITHSWSDDGPSKYVAIREWYEPFIVTETDVNVWLVSCRRVLTGARSRRSYTRGFSILWRSGQGVHRPAKHRCESRLAAALPIGLQASSLLGWPNIRNPLVVRSRAVCVFEDGRLKGAHRPEESRRRGQRGRSCQVRLRQGKVLPRIRPREDSGCYRDGLRRHHAVQ